MTDESPSGRYTRLMVRISEELRRRLTASADKHGRSLSAEMLLRIEMSFAADEAASKVADLVEEHESGLKDHEDRIKELEKDVTRLLDQAGLLIDYR